MKKYILGTLFTLCILISPAFVPQAEAAALSATQISAIIGLLQAFGADQSVINSVQAALGGGSTTLPSGTAPTALITINGQTQVNNADPLVSRTWAWSSTKGTTYSASGNITGCENASQNGPQSNWKPWIGGTGSAVSGSTSAIPGAVKYGCTIVGTYNVTKNGKTTTATATITYKHANGTGQNPAILTTHKLPPTGITTYSDATTNTADASVGLDTGAFPRQDARYNRPFDYTKIANDGTSLPSTAILGTGAKDWACTKDNITGLVWEVKTTSGLRNKDYTYTWYRNGVGTPTGGTCQTTGRCDTEKFSQDVNQTNLCGFSDWRLPGVKELEGVVNFQNVIKIDGDFFPNIVTGNHHYWTSTISSNAGSLQGWGLGFILGAPSTYSYSTPDTVLLVHGTSSFTPVDSPSTNSFCVPEYPQSESNPNSVYKVSPSNDGTVTDIRTGLMWKRCSEGQTWDKSTYECLDSEGDKNITYYNNYPKFSESTYEGASFHWGEALKTGRNSTFAGYSDWRLPNAKELQSIVEECRSVPAINIAAFPSVPFGSIDWSSSAVNAATLFSSSGQKPSWGVSYYVGTMQDWSRDTTNLHVRLVRDVTPESNNNTLPLSGVTPFNTLTLNRSGNGKGKIIFQTNGVDCHSDYGYSGDLGLFPSLLPCTHTTTGYKTLTAVPFSDSTFAGWSGGDCSGTSPTCVVAMTSARSATAIFNLKTGGNQNPDPTPAPTTNPHANEVCSDGNTVAWHEQNHNHVVVSPQPLYPTCADYGVGSPTVSITTLSPSSGQAGTTVSITASGLLGTNSIYLNGSPVDTLYSSGGSTPTWISFVIPSNLPSCPGWDRFCVPGPVLTHGSYTVRVQNTNGTSNAVSFGVN